MASHPTPIRGASRGYTGYDWSDPEFVAQAHENRKGYIEQDRQMLDIVKGPQAQGASVEEIARTVSARRNQIRLDSFKDDPEGLSIVKARNLERYGNEEGPTPEWLYNRYGSWEAVIDSAFSTNPGMDACCGLYDQNWEQYIYFGQIPLCAVSFDVAGHGSAPAEQAVYAGERPDEPEDPSEEGWAFRGWFAEGSTEPFDFTAPIAEDVVLTASWEQIPAQDEGYAGADTTSDTPQTGDVPAPEADAPKADNASPADSAKPSISAKPVQSAKPQAQTTAGQAATLPATGDPVANLSVAACATFGVTALALGIAARQRRA